MTVNINNGAISAIRLVQQASAPAALSGSVRLYANNETLAKLSIIDDDGTVTRFIGNTSGSGQGITFPNSASTNATTLDWYEEATWTPVIEGSVTPGTATYSVQHGFVTRIGRMVYVQCYLDWTLHDGSGSMRITGLPFSTNAALNGRVTGTVLTRSLDWAGGTYVVAYITANSNIVTIYGITDNADWTAQTIKSSGSINLSIQYVI